MKASVLLLICAASIGTIAFNPKAASADVDLNFSNQGTSVHFGSPTVVQDNPIIVERHNSDWRYREEVRLREEQRIDQQHERERIDQQHERERFAQQHERERFDQQRQHDQYTAQQHEHDAMQTSSHVYSSNNRQQQNNSFNNSGHDRYNH